jgi:serine protease Do
VARRHVSRSVPPVVVVLTLALLFGPVPRVLAASAASILDEYSRAAAAVAAAIKPSVVYIEVTMKPDGETARAVQRRPGAPPHPEVRGQASGIIISPTGDILTNAHVTEKAAKIMVSVPAGETYTAAVVGVDKIRDLAVIRIKPSQPLPAATLGNADQSPAGSWVMAVGFPFGAELDPALRYDPSVAVGTVSALHRDVETDSPDETMTDLLQTDAAINPGNSGGPLVNSHGEVIGVNEGIFTSGDVAGNIGVGFAIPVDPRTTQIVRTLQSGRSVVRGLLGVAVAPLTPERKQETGAQYGAFVRRVNPDSPASRAGVQPGDVIVGYNGQRVNSTDDLIGMIYASPPGSTASIEVLRNRRTVALQATVAELPLT